jgi:hypothetical protein
MLNAGPLGAYTNQKRWWKAATNTYVSDGRAWRKPAAGYHLDDLHDEGVWARRVHCALSGKRRDDEAATQQCGAHTPGARRALCVLAAAQQDDV